MDPTNLISDGYIVEDEFLSKGRCDQLLAMIGEYRSAHEVPQIYRNVRGRPLKYSVIDGELIKKHLPEIHELLESVRAVIVGVVNEPVAPLEDTRVACNVNITGRGGTYRWHYDRNRFTALLYLNEVDGGETEMYPNYRLNLGRSRGSRLQRVADSILGAPMARSLFGKHRKVSPKAGRLLIMMGETCLHSVRPVISEHDRINIVLSYDTPGKTYEVASGLDSYLYTDSKSESSDPNYVK